MSAMTTDKLVYMANQIARNMALEPDPVAVVADHIAAFWTPRMLGQIFAHGEAGLDPIAAKALAQLEKGHEPAPQTRATDPHAHGTDAG
ncbi:MAG: hypothetical protein RIS94_326 [Pseudomonadota bacterium]|jgi:formate dehydrogenase subunit delta